VGYALQIQYTAYLFQFISIPMSSPPSSSMSSDLTSPPTPESAHALLKQFDCLQPQSVPRDRYLNLRQALLVVVEHSDYQMLGICADDLEQGRRALETYAQALGYQPNFEGLTPTEGAVYIKFNGKSNACYVAPYAETYRGVLVSCQSSEADGVNDMYGHLPLDLFQL
jgi:Domain of unknown function (DUF1824)